MPRHSTWCDSNRICSVRSSVGGSTRTAVGRPALPASRDLSPDEGDRAHDEPARCDGRGRCRLRCEMSPDGRGRTSRGRVGRARERGHPNRSGMHAAPWMRISARPSGPAWRASTSRSAGSAASTCNSSWTSEGDPARPAGRVDGPGIVVQSNDFRSPAHRR